MSESSAQRIDPRFDPRFQRGYIADAALPTPEPAAAPAAPTIPAARGADTKPDDPAAALSDLFARVERDSVDGDSTDDAPAHHDPAEVHQVAAGAAPAEPDPGTDVDVSPTRWFWIALAACVVFIVVGVALFWNGASDRSMFRGAPSGLEGAFNQFSMTLAPGLVQAGVIGAVIVLVMWAITGRRSRRGVE